MSLPNRSTLSTFGGSGKLNYANVPPANPVTDFDNPSLAKALSDVAGLGLTSPRFWARITLSTTTGGLVLNNWKAVWQNVTTTTPILARSGTGIFTITLPTTVSDEYSSSVGTPSLITVNLSSAQCTLEEATPGFTNAQASGNVITLRTFNAGGSANDLDTLVVFVVGY